MAVNKATAAWVLDHCSGKSVVLSSGARRLNELQQLVVINLCMIDVINFVKVTPDAIFASSEVTGYHKTPVTKPEHPTAIGVWVVFEWRNKVLEFAEINSLKKGYGSKMVDAVLSALPTDWQFTVVFDQSDGFWEKVRNKYESIAWLDV